MRIEHRRGAIHLTELRKRLQTKLRRPGASAGTVQAIEIGTVRPRYNGALRENRKTSWFKRDTHMNRPCKPTNVLPKKRILLVDDDPSVREMLTRVLVGEEYLVMPAASGPDA